MIDHLSSYTTNFDKARAFYVAALAPLGAEPMRDMTMSWDPADPTRRMCAFGPSGKPVLWLFEVRAAHSPTHVAFAAKDEATVKAFHEAGIAAGGKDNGQPGTREHYHPGYFGSFVIDPDGNNVEACFHQHQPA